jgi:hypothetical protein
MLIHQERPMNIIAAYLAAEHFKDLLREADDERRLALVKASKAPRPSGGSGLGSRLLAAIRRPAGAAGTAGSSAAPSSSAPTQAACV